MIRILAFGLRGLTKGWIVFDSILVLIGSVFYIVSYTTNISLDPGASSSLRIIRIARVCSLFQYLCRYFHLSGNHKTGFAFFSIQRISQGPFEHHSIYSARCLCFCCFA
jgi:hypothetical protein